MKFRKKVERDIPHYEEIEAELALSLHLFAFLLAVIVAYIGYSYSVHFVSTIVASTTTYQLVFIFKDYIVEFFYKRALLRYSFDELESFLYTETISDESRLAVDHFITSGFFKYEN